MKSINWKHYKEIDSTQNEIWRLIESKEITNNTVISADIQTNGRGTHGRIWHTDEKNNIAFSIYVETNCNIEKLNGITIEIANNIVDIFNMDYGIKLDIKKPNDLIINNKKVGGILTESKMISENVKFLVIGIGINTNQISFNEDIQDIATSIKKEFNIEINANEFVEKFCNKFDETIKRRI